MRPGQTVPPLVAKVPQIERGKAEVAAAEARVALAELELDRTRLSLPFSGRVTSSTAEVGQVLGKGQSFGRAFALDALEIAVPVAEDDLTRLTPIVGRAAVVSAGGRSVDAVVERVSAELDERTRFATVYLTFGSAPGLIPGTFVSVALQGPEQEDTFLLPDAAAQMGGRVWVVEDGVLRSETPQVFGRREGGLLVPAFDAGDGIVIGAVPGARDGLPVAIANAGA